ncbi:hypothetical protein M5X06_22300 [Paenibacillus alvei]|uniref:Uncharacterized protein n=1 Tax=Paenibacillus alvei TaxID=44250 RepID=A0ABT4H2L1_PAEAL|nr:hypothetical protein [Paenibacillus alvei]MCY9763189.1 hypothetical protein [Paenibacillus alvei]MCY9769522.1 hypothetical protein [Paenibacillus alvei]
MNLVTMRLKQFFAKEKIANRQYLIEYKGSNQVVESDYVIRQILEANIEDQDAIWNELTAFDGDIHEYLSRIATGYVFAERIVEFNSNEDVLEGGTDKQYFFTRLSAEQKLKLRYLEMFLSEEFIQKIVVSDTTDVVDEAFRSIAEDLFNQ